MTYHFGLIGFPLGHSLSPLIHTRIMDIAGIKGEYRLYELEPRRLKVELPKLLQALDGLNCTIPHKQSVIPYLDALAPSARLYGAVNTMHRSIGHNTDGAGFVACQVPMKGRSVAILGAGGVARVFALEAARSGASRIIVQARNEQQAQVLIDHVQEQGFSSIDFTSGQEPAFCDVLLNGTPCGMWPNVGELPAEERQIARAKAVFDAIYNPSASRLVLKAKSQDSWALGGLTMLFEQALAAQKIWHPDVDFDQFAPQFGAVKDDLAREVLRQSPLKIVLTGFMGSGKSHVGRLLAKCMELPFEDLDEVVERTAQQSVAEIFQAGGEGAFREMEKRILMEQLEKPASLVLATGGGAVIQAGMADKIHKAGALVIYLDVALKTALERIGFDLQRPMLHGGDRSTETLYQSRRPLYEASADLRVDGEKHPQEIVDIIMDALEWKGGGGYYD